jgi:hypothetical protein
MKLRKDLFQASTSFAIYRSFGIRGKDLRFIEIVRLASVLFKKIKALQLSEKWGNYGR